MKNEKNNNQHIMSEELPNKILSIKEKSTQYIISLRNDQLEAIKALALVIFSIYLTFKFIGSYDSTSGYDIRGEFCGYLIQLSFLTFLYINFKAKEDKNLQNLKCFSLLQVLLSITNFLIIKSLSTFFILKLTVLFSAILLFLALIRGISK